MLINLQFTPALNRGEIVYDNNDRVSRDGEPTRTKLWVWENKYDPSYGKQPGYSGGAMLYLLKDGPGADAKDVRWVSEEDLREWYPAKKEESLIDL